MVKSTLRIDFLLLPYQHLFHMIMQIIEFMFYIFSAKVWTESMKRKCCHNNLL